MNLRRNTGEVGWPEPAKRGRPTPASARQPPSVAGAKPVSARRRCSEAEPPIRAFLTGARTGGSTSAALFAYYLAAQGVVNGHTVDVVIHLDEVDARLIRG